MSTMLTWAPWHPSSSDSCLRSLRPLTGWLWEYRVTDPGASFSPVQKRALLTVQFAAVTRSVSELGLRSTEPI